MGNGIGTAEAMEVITWTHLVLIALFALVVAFAIWWGVKRRRARLRAEEEALERREEEGGAAPVAEASVVPPVAPPPPPLADVPIPASAPQEANPAALAVDEDAEPAQAVSTALGDGKVTMIKGLGPKVAARLAENGITRVDQLAALSDDEAAVLDATLGNFSGRMARDRWIEQARLLAAGDREGFEARFGKLG
jgi:predicted flap endonuclease-1-like 5' DNA nuclease